MVGERSTMTSPVRSGLAWRQIQRLFGLGTLSGLTEWQLLRRYAERRDEEAFEALVARHGSMVLGVCLRLLNDPEDVEDAFQATFLVLVRKARALRPHNSIGPWLYAVAYRVALRARSDSVRRRSRERPADAGEVALLTVEGYGLAHDFELRTVLDAEIARLPATYRAAIVLCYLEGQTHEEAARHLGWPVGTVKGRLARARDLLRGRLTRRGLTLSISGLGSLLAREAEASVPARWIESVVRAAVRVAVGEATAGVVSASSAGLAEGVIGTMILNQMKTAAAALAVLAAVAVGATVYAQHSGRNTPKEAAPAGAPTRNPDPVDSADSLVGPETPKPASGQKVDETRVPNPVASIGYQLALKEYLAGNVKAETVHLWSRRLAEHEAHSPDPGRRAQAAEGHRKRMTQLERVAHQNPSTTNTLDDLNARYYREEAEAPVKAETENDGAAGSKGTSTEPGKDPRSLAILKKLDEPVTMNFANETPLEVILEYIKESTKSAEFPNGLAIYIDPIGLQEAEKTMTSPVAIDLQGVPLRRTLYLVLKQLGLEYRVEDGMVYITAEYSENTGSLPPPIRQVTPMMMMQEKAERGEMSPAERKAFIEMLKDLNEINALIHGKEGTRRIQ
jgi:RNA polymerase sigma factor (sigma-70 family)